MIHSWSSYFGVFFWMWNNHCQNVDKNSEFCFCIWNYKCRSALVVLLIMLTFSPITEYTSSKCMRCQLSGVYLEERNGTCCASVWIQFVTMWINFSLELFYLPYFSSHYQHLRYIMLSLHWYVLYSIYLPWSHYKLWFIFADFMPLLPSAANLYILSL